MKTVTYENMLEYLDRAVKEVGEDYIDPLAKRGLICKYTYSTGRYGGCGHCIIGWIMLNCMDVPPRHEAMRFEGSVVRAFGRLSDTFVERDAETLAIFVQAEQDMGKTWGEAVAFAKEKMEN